MSNPNLDIRALIGTSEKETNAQLISLGYTPVNKIESPHQNPSFKDKQYVSIYQMMETQIVCTIVREKCVSIGVVYQTINQPLREWIEKSTTVVKNARLNSAVPPGVHAEVREDQHFWYSIRMNEEVYNVSVTSKYTVLDS